jgi:hypothetical protein
MEKTTGTQPAGIRVSGIRVGWVIQSLESSVMVNKTFWESFKTESENAVEKLKQLIHEGNVRRIVIQHQGRTVAEFPLTAGVVGALLAPVLAAIGAIVALLKDCTIQVEREDKPGNR